MMAQSTSTLRQAVFAGLALVATALSFAATTRPALAATPAQKHYTAALAAPLAAPQKVILDGVVWNCAGQTCVAAPTGSRDVTVCGRLADRIGTVASFTGPRGTLAEADLARCNGA